MNSFKEKCIELRKQGHTLPEIMKITGRPKTSIHFHIQNIELSPERKAELRIKNLERLLKFAGSKKGISVRAFTKFAEWNKNMVSLVSHLLFDGEIKHGGCVYNNRNLALIELVQKSMGRIYDYPPRPYLNKVTGVSRISYFNVALSAYFKEKAKDLIEQITSLPIELKSEFLKAFFDDEGCMDYRPKDNYRRVRGYQKDKSILYLIRDLLLDLNIQSRIVQPNEVVISGKENLEKFRDQINFSPGVRINGNRSNSIWKKSLEKRNILDQAIKSFRH